MSGFHVEQAVCHGRDFSAPAGPVLGGLLYYLKVFAPKLLTSGGMGWYLHDDQSALGTDPYIVISSHNAAGPNVPAKYVQILLPSATSAMVRTFYYIYWNPTTHTGLGLYGVHNIQTDDSIDFIYDFRGGPECFFIHTYTTAALWHGAWIDEITADPNLIDSVEAITTVANFVGADAQFRGMDLTAGVMSSAVDASGKMYMNIEFVSGTNWRISMYNNSAKGGGDLVWRSNNFTALAAEANQSTVAGTAQNSSGLGFNVYVQGPTVADTTIVFRPLKITVGSGEGAQFVVDSYYVVTDHTVKNAVNFVKIASKSGDTLTLATTTPLYRPFPVGAKIWSYGHKFFVAGTASTLWTNRSGIPYYNVAGTMARYQSSSGGAAEQSSLLPATLGGSWSGTPSNFNGPHAITSAEDNYISRLSPDRRGRYAVQRPGIVERVPFGESISVASGQTAYGQLKNVILGVTGTMSPNLNGRTLAGIDYLYFRQMNNYSASNVQVIAAMIRDSQSNT